MLARFLDSAGTAERYADSVRAGVDYPAFAVDVGGAALTWPGDSSATWLVLEPGHYAVLCWVADHMQLGMAHDLVVTASAPAPAPAAPPAPPAATHELVLQDYDYVLDHPLVSGHQVVHVVNRGTEPHEADILELSDTAGFDAYRAWLDGNQRGLPPVRPVGGIGDIMPGTEAWLELTLRPGRYLVLCTITAKPGGKPHYALGMRREVTVP
jgi:uncharacterized cupredoxin-like copper-binding protein